MLGFRRLGGLIPCRIATDQVTIVSIAQTAAAKGSTVRPCKTIALNGGSRFWIMIS